MYLHILERNSPGHMYTQRELMLPSFPLIKRFDHYFKHLHTPSLPPPFNTSLSYCTMPKLKTTTRVSTSRGYTTPNTHSTKIRLKNRASSASPASSTVATTPSPSSTSSKRSSGSMQSSTSVAKKMKSMKLDTSSSPSKSVKSLVFNVDDDDDDDDDEDVMMLTTQTSNKKKKSSTTEKKSSKSNQDKDLDEKKKTNKKNEKKTNNDVASKISNKKKSAKKSKNNKIEEKTKGGTKSSARSTSSPGSRPLLAFIDWSNPAQCRKILESMPGVDSSDIEDWTNEEVRRDILEMYNVGELKVATTLLASKSGQDQVAVEAIYSTANNGTKKKLIPLMMNLIDKKVSYEK